MQLDGQAWAESQLPLSSDTYVPKLLAGLASLRSKGLLCDVTLEAEGVSFPAHRVILAVASSSCKAHFFGDDTSREGHIKLPSVTALGLQNVLSFVYSNKLDLSLSTVEETFKAAEALLVREVMRLCLRFLEESVNRHTCLQILGIASRLGSDGLEQKARSCISQHCVEILRDLPQLKELDREALGGILDREDIGGLSELELFQAAISWLHHRSERLKDAADILGRIRFPLIPLPDLQKCVQAVSIMKTEPTCCRYLQEALDYHAHLHAQPTSQSERTRLRGGAHALLILGGRTADNTICSDAWAAPDPNCPSWRKVQALKEPLYNHCVAVLQDFVFVLGGQNNFNPTGQCPSNKVFRFDPRHDRWIQVSSLLERRTRFHAGVLGERIVAVGGGTLHGALTDTAEEYWPAENRWQLIKSLPAPVADHAGATHKGILYVSGGFGAGKTLCDMYSYLARLGCWIRNRPMTFARCDHGMAAVGEKLLCVGGRALAKAEEWVSVNEVECYCPAADQWTRLPLPPFSLSQFGLAVHQLQVFLTGGGSLQDRRKEDGVFACRPAEATWEKMGSLPLPLADHACCSARLSCRLLAGEGRQDGETPPAPTRKKSTLNLFITPKYVSQAAP